MVKMAEEKQKEIPPLEELAKGSFNEVREYLPYLSLPEVLIVGARPLDREPRSYSEVRKFSVIAKGKLRDLEGERERILMDIMGNLYPNEEFGVHDVSNYLDKYEFIIGNIITEDLLSKIESIDETTLDRIADFRVTMKQKSRGHYKGMPMSTDYLSELTNTPVNLRFYFNKNLGSEPCLITSKTKAYERIAKKIAYNMIKDFRKSYGKKITTRKGLKDLNFDDGINKDNVGLQIVPCALGKDGRDQLVMVKTYIFQSSNIEVVLNKKGEDVEDYGAKHVRDYASMHIDTAWNPRSSNAAQFNPHRDTVELQLVYIPDFIRANFGPRSYWSRKNAQNLGIVPPNLRGGALVPSTFTDVEGEWKKMVEDRIVYMLTYGNLK